VADSGLLKAGVSKREKIGQFLKLTIKLSMVYQPTYLLIIVDQ